MGIVYNHAGQLLKAKKKGVNFGKTITIGHQSLYIRKDELLKLARAYNVKSEISKYSWKDYADDFFKDFLGATDVLSIDHSDYQNCDVVHDMNTPIDASQYNQYDVVIDGGACEHIFNFPVCIENMMKMVKPGGSLFIITTCNNMMGHGFYQFSPEVFYRIFDKSNGFAIKEVVLEMFPFPGPELSSGKKLYSVIDPDKVKKRVQLVTKSPVEIMVHAVKTESKQIFESYPIQSDYASRHADFASGINSAEHNPHIFKKSFAKNIHNKLPLRLKNYISGKLQLLRYNFSNKEFYEKWDPLDH